MRVHWLVRWLLSTKPVPFAEKFDSIKMHYLYFSLFSLLLIVLYVADDYFLMH